MRIIDLGHISYGEAMVIQAEAAERLREGGEASLFLLEHPPVITFGRNSGEEHLPLGPDYFTSRGVEIHRSSRGGSITCHFPGQLVAYPIMRVERRRGGLRGLVTGLEESVIRTLARFGLAAGRSEGRPGVWIDDRKKICSIGLAVSRWISSHGLALNVARDLALFEMVSPCGLPGVQATSVCRELDGPSPGLSEIKDALAREFCSVFGIEAEIPFFKDADDERYK